MKRFFRILLISLFVLGVVIFTVPFIFKGKIVQFVKYEINKYINAEVDFGRASLWWFSHFPNMTLYLNDFVIKGNYPFAGDTLVYVASSQFTIHLPSVLRGNYEISRIALNRPGVYLKVLENGAYNWDIMLPSTEVIPDSAELQPEKPFLVALSKVVLNNGVVKYDDREIDFLVEITGLDATASGDLGESLSEFVIQAKAKALSMEYDGMPLLTEVRANYAGIFKLDLDKDYYTMINNKATLNDLPINVDGGFGFVGDDIILDIRFNSADKDFKNLLSLIPALYRNDFDKLSAGGEFDLKGIIIGFYGETTMPSFGLNLKVGQGWFSYEGMPGRIDRIAIDAAFENLTGKPDDTVVDLKEFKASMAGNPLFASLFLTDIESNPFIRAKLQGTIDFESLKSLIPIPDYDYTGMLNADFSFEGSRSDIENKRYQHVKADGNIEFSNLNTNAGISGIPVRDVSGRLSLTPAALQVTELKACVGKSDFLLSGRVQDYLPYLFFEGELKAGLELKSKLLDINELLSFFPGDTLAANQPDTARITMPEMPERIAFVANANVAKLYYSTYELNDIKATVRYENKTIRLDPLDARLLSGGVTLRGNIDAANHQETLVDLNLELNQIDIPAAYSAIGMFQQIAPIARRAKGLLSTRFNIKGKLDHELNPVYDALQGSGKLQTSQLVVETGQVTEQLASLLGNDEYKKLNISGLNLAFSFLNGKVFQQPTEFTWAGTKTTMAGYVGFDQQLSLDLVFEIPYEKFGSGVNSAMNRIKEEALRKGVTVSAGSNLLVNARISGSVLNPKIQLDYRQAVAGLRQEIETIARQALQEQKEQLISRLSAEAEKILADAKARGDQLIEQAEQAAVRIRTEAAQAAAKVRSEAQQRAKILEDEGMKKGMIAGIAAREAAKKVVAEADGTSTRIESEAEAKANEVIRQARMQAEELMNKAREQAEKLQKQE